MAEWPQKPVRRNWRWILVIVISCGALLLSLDRYYWKWNNDSVGITIACVICVSSLLFEWCIASNDAENDFDISELKQSISELKQSISELKQSTSPLVKQYEEAIAVAAGRIAEEARREIGR